MWKTFFSKLSGWHLATSQQINFFTDSFQGFWLNEHIPMAVSCFYTKCLKSTCEIVLVYAGWNPVTCS